MPTTTPPVHSLAPESYASKTEVALDYSTLQLKQHCPSGMYVLSSKESIMVWNVVFFVHQGYYSDSILKFTVAFPPTYPSQPPEIVFESDVFHPLVSTETGKMSLSVMFDPWRPREHRIFTVLHYIKFAFKKRGLDEIQEKDCLNAEAFRLYRESITSFAALATQSAMLSHSETALYPDESTTGTVGFNGNESGRPSVKDGSARAPVKKNTGHSRNISKSGIEFKKVSEGDLEKMREALGLGSW